MNGSAGKRVLVVDDDEALRNTIIEVLADNGYDPVGAADGKEALAWLQGLDRPCLILLDLMMPNMNGWQFRHAQQQDPSLAEICTAVMTANAHFASAPIQADHYLWKPVRIERLLEVVEECCGFA